MPEQEVDWKETLKNAHLQMTGQAPVAPQPQEAPVEESEEQAEESVAPESSDSVVFDFSGEEPSAPQPENIDELKEQIKALIEERERLKNEKPFADQRIQKLNEYVKVGGNIDRRFWELQEKNYDNVDFKSKDGAVNILKDKLIYSDGLDESEAERVISRRYSGLFSDDEDEVQDALLDARIEVKKNLDELKTVQEKALLPKIDETQRKQQEDAVRIYQADASNALSGIESVKINLSDDLPVEVPLKGELRNYIASVVTKPENQARFFVDNYVMEDNKVDFQKFVRDFTFLKHGEQLVKRAYQQGLAHGEKSVAKELRQEPATTPKRDSHVSSGDWKNSIKEGFAKLRY
jgi:hypothetical protein